MLLDLTRSGLSTGAWLIGAMAALGVGCIQPDESADLPAIWLAPATFSHNDSGVLTDPDGTGQLDASGEQKGGPDGGTSGVTDPGTGTTGSGTGSQGVDPGTGSSGIDPGTATSGLGVTGMDFSVLTKNQGGRYSPRNIGAIWIASSSGQWVKTLAVWAGARQRYLSKWISVSGANKVDAVTSSTISSYQAHDVSWDLTDASGNTVPAGDYTVWVEVTDHNGAGATTSSSFTVGLDPVVLNPPDQTFYVDMSIDVQ